MLFLSQVLGEEEDADRRKELIDVLTRAVKFTGQAQTAAGGWGYVSAKDGGDFDEGSTTITQVQGLRGCRNAGIPVPKEIIDKAVKYIRKCTGPGRRRAVQFPAAAAAARRSPPPPSPACSTPATTTSDKYVPQAAGLLRAEPGQHLQRQLSFGHWHYAHYYYSQVLYREGGKKWEAYRNKIFARLVGEADARRLVEPGLHRRGLHHRHEPDDPATGSSGTLPIYQR